MTTGAGKVNAKSNTITSMTKFKGVKRDDFRLTSQIHDLNDIEELAHSIMRKEENLRADGEGEWANVKVLEWQEFVITEGNKCVAAYQDAYNAMQDTLGGTHHAPELYGREIQRGTFFCQETRLAVRTFISNVRNFQARFS